MPWKPKRPCAKPGCPGLVEAGGKCPVCGYQPGARPGREYERERGSAASRGYDSDWRRFRLWFLTRHPVCEHVDEQGRRCFEPAVDVHHVIPKAEGGPDSEENCRALCHRHHSAVEAESGRRWGPRPARG